MPHRDIGDSDGDDRSTDRLLGELVAEVRAVKHNQANAAQKLDAVGRQTAPIQGLVEQIKEIKTEQERHHFRLTVLEADQHRREGAIGLVAWVSRHWPITLLLAAISAFIAWANGVDVK